MVRRRKRDLDPHERATERGVLAAVAVARRLELGLRQDELAELAEVSPRFVYNVEAGKQSLQLDKVAAVLEALGLHLTVERGADREIRAGDDLLPTDGFR